MTVPVATARAFLTQRILEAIATGSPVEYTYPNYGYDIYIPNIVMAYLESEISTEYDDRSSAHKRRIAELSPYFYDAAWELCLEGILRPGVQRLGLQSTDGGSAGNGYSITGKAHRLVS